MTKVFHICLFVLFTFIFTACNKEELKAIVDKDVITPYFELIKQERYEESYSMTSDRYKQYISYDEYIESYHRVIKKYGKFLKWASNSMTFKPLYSFTGSVIEIQYEIGLTFENKKHAVCGYFILRPKGEETYGLDSGWHNNRACVREIDGTLDGPY